MFGFGMQDVVRPGAGPDRRSRGARARASLATADAIDRRKLRPLVAAIAAGNHELVRLASARPRDDRQARRPLDARTEPERAISRRLGLGDCLARPAR